MTSQTIVEDSAYSVFPQKKMCETKQYKNLIKNMGFEITQVHTQILIKMSTFCNYLRSLYII